MLKNLAIPFYSIFLILPLYINLHSQIISDASSISMANSNIANSKNAFTIYNNPAGLALSTNRELGVFYSPFPFGIKELASGTVAFSEPTSFGNFGIGLSTFGFDLYKENQIRIGYSTKIAENFYTGVSLYYHSVAIKRYGTSHKINFSLGSIFLLSDNFSIGFSLHNPLRYGNSNIHLPLIYNFGLSYNLSNKSSINISILKEINFPISAHFGIEYPLIDIIYLRLGTQTEPNLYSGGVGIKYSFIQFNYAINSHLELGLTHQFDIILKLN